MKKMSDLYKKARILYTLTPDTFMISLEKNVGRGKK